MQVIIQIRREEVANKLTHSNTLLLILRAELRLGLRLEDWVVNPHRDRRNDRCADIGRLIVLMVELLDGLSHCLTEGRLVRTALWCVLTIDKRVVCLAIAITVGDNNLDILIHNVNRRIQRLTRKRIVDQVQKTILRDIRLIVKHHREAEVQIGIVLNHLLDILQIVAIWAKDLSVDNELHIGAISLRNSTLRAVSELQTLRKGYRASLAISHGTSKEVARQHIHSLDTDTIQTHRLLKGVATILTTRIHLAHRIGKSLQRNTTAIVTNRDLITLNLNLDALTSTHNELVDRVIDNLF